MARTTLGKIISRAHKLAAIPELTSGRTDALAEPDEMIDEVNSGLAELHDLIVDSYQDFLTISAEIEMVANEQRVLLPSDFYKLRSIFAYESSDQRRRLSEWQMADQGRYRVAEAWDYPDYSIISNHIEWLPLPSTTRSVVLYYVRQFVPLEETTDELTPEVPTGWEDYVVGYAANYLFEKQDLDPSAALSKMERAKKRIVSSAAKRNASEPRRTVDVMNRYSGYRRHRLGWPRN